MTLRRTPESVIELIRAADRIALTSHVHPDGDTLGSALALALALRKMGKTAHVFCDDPVPQVLRMMPGSDDVRTSDQADEAYDLLIAVDTADEKRMGACQALVSRAGATAQVDHHGTNPAYMQANDVDPGASATALLVHEMIGMLNVTLDRDIATCLYVAITTDTGNLSFSNTTAEAFRVMGDLMACGVPMSELNRTLFHQRTAAQIGVLTSALNSLRYMGDGEVTMMTLDQAEQQRFGALGEDAEGIVNYGLDIAGVKMTAFLRELENGDVKVSMRAVAPHTVDQIARAFGGGGHTQAAGCTMHYPLDEAARLLEKAMLEAMGKEQA